MLSCRKCFWAAGGPVRPTTAKGLARQALVIRRETGVDQELLSQLPEDSSKVLHRPAIVFLQVKIQFDLLEMV